MENVLREINKIHKCRKLGSFYLQKVELINILQQAYQLALKKAALETFERRYETEELAVMIDQE